MKDCEDCAALMRERNQLAEALQFAVNQADLSRAALNQFVQNYNAIVATNETARKVESREEETPKHDDTG
jgi:uncharacterized protein YdgA (DUF945 family)